MDKESLVVHVQKLLFKKYMKNHNFFFFFNKVEEKKITYEKFIHLLGLKKNIGVCFAFKLSMFEFEF